jgi:hypothetical protein
MSRSLTIALGALLGLFIGTASGGTFLNVAANQNRVVHGGGYTGTGGEVAVSVCLDPGALPLSGDPEQAIRNAVAAFNALVPTNGNVVSRSDGAGGSDFESVLLHEVGHCIGMDHNALGPSETCDTTPDPFDSPHLYFANAFPGSTGAASTCSPPAPSPPVLTGVFSTNPGVDGVRGSRDDIRGGDINRNWFRKNVNNPFETPPAIVDRGNYSMTVADLPVGHSFVENSTSFAPCSGPNTSALRGVTPTQNTMFPVNCNPNHIRRLAPDDVALLRVARAGLNGTQGDADDYTLKLTYVGQASNCNIKIQFTSDAGFAVCQVGLSSIAGSNDWRVTSGTAKFLRSANWYFNPNDTTGGGGGTPTCSGDCIFRNGFE